MNLPAAIFAVKWLIRDTFRQALASGVFWLMLGVSAICAGTCLSVSIVGDAPLHYEGEKGVEALPRSDAVKATTAAVDLVPAGAAQIGGAWRLPAPLFSTEYKQVALAVRDGVPLVRGRLEIAFGAAGIDLTRGREDAVKTLRLHMVGWVADAAGLLLALIWTAGFLPSFLEPGAASVLLAKPVPRWSLLAGKFAGVLAFVGFQALVFVASTWLALGVRTSVWDPSYFLCVPILLLHFAVFFSFSTMLAVATRSTVACVFGSILFWLLCWAMNFGRHSTVLLPDLQSLSPLFAHTIELGYWILPKPLDFHFVLLDTLQADHVFTRVVDTNALAERGAWLPGWSVLASVAFAVGVLVVAAYDFVTTDY